MKKLEQIATKYNERAKEKLEEIKPTIRMTKREKSMIPILKKINIKNVSEEIADDQDSIETVEPPEKEETKTGTPNKHPDSPVDNNLNDKEPVAESTRKSKTPKNRVPISRREPPVKDDKSDMPEKQNEKHREKETKKIDKEISMSLDSLEDIPPDSSRNYQSVGINTELLCVPCVIHENTETKNSSKKFKTNHVTVSKEVEDPEPSVELLYKNPTMVSSCDVRIREHFESTDSKEYLSVSNSKRSLINNSYSGNFTSDNIESSVNLTPSFESEECKASKRLKKIEISEIQLDQKCESEETDDLSAENCEENNELDVSNELYDSIEAKSEDVEMEDQNNGIECRYGSGETYTKFTENPDDLDEFMNLTDKLMTGHKDEEQCEMDEDIENLHTPKTNSLETINKDNLEEDNIEESQLKKYNFSDTFKDLKNNFKDLMAVAGDNVVLEKTKANEAEDEANKKVSDMEHITVYELKFYERQALVEQETATANEKSEFKLPSIEETNKPKRKIVCNKKRMQKIYKPNRKYKLLGEKNRASEDCKTFIVNPEDNSDVQSITSEAPPLKLPRIENKKRLDYFAYP